METFIKSLSDSYGYFIRRTYSVFLSIEHQAMFSVVNINNKPAILINGLDVQKVYFPKSLQYYFSSSECNATLAYKADNLWILEERCSNGILTCQVGVSNCPDVTWRKFNLS